MSGAALATPIQGRLAGLISDEEFAAAKAHPAAERDAPTAPAGTWVIVQPPDGYDSDADDAA